MPRLSNQGSSSPLRGRYGLDHQQRGGTLGFGNLLGQLRGRRSTGTHTITGTGGGLTETTAVSLVVAR